MNYLSGVVYLSIYAVISYICVEIGVFDSSYRNDEKTKSMLMKDTDVWAAEWCKLHVLLTSCSVFVLIRGWHKATNRKITVLDFFFLMVFCGLTVMESVGLYLTYRKHLPDISLDYEDLAKQISRLRVFTDWAALPLLGWIIAWSRHIRRGWYPKRNRVVFAICIAMFFPTIIHQIAYAFQIGVVGVLSCIAIYEIYTVHFYRPGVKPMFWTVIISTVIFYSTRLADVVFEISLWKLFYVNVISLTCATTTVSVMFLKILESVNENKR